MARLVASEPVQFRACEAEQRRNPLRLDGEPRRDQLVVRACLVQTQCDRQRERKLSDLSGTVHQGTVGGEMPMLISNAVLHLPAPAMQ
jgi:hypothetical protein